MTARKISAFRAKFTSNMICPFRPVQKCSFWFLKSRRSTTFDKCLWNLSKCPNRRSPKGSSGECKLYFLNLNEPDVGGQHCPDSVLIYCAMSASKNLKLSVKKAFECPDFEFELHFDRQTPHWNPDRIRTALSADIWNEHWKREIYSFYDSKSTFKNIRLSFRQSQT